jgi:hypothetical protein
MTTEVKFIAICDGQFGTGETPEASYEELAESYTEYEGERLPITKVDVYRVNGCGKPKFNIDWSEVR